MARYIGARYIPVFYENSGDGSTLWEPNVVYEPLTWVTLTNGHMYLSKKKVPATIGSPALNVAYWLDVAQYNGFIQDLEDRMDDAEHDIDDLQTDVGTLQTDVAALDKKVSKKWIFVGDSYANYPNPTSGWFKYLIDYTGLTLNTDVFTCADAGIGFGDTTYNFLNPLQAIENNIPDPTAITDILVAGGINDRSYTAAQIATGIANFATYCATQYPNAKVHIAGIGLTALNDQMYAYYTTVIESYKLCNVHDNMNYVTDSEFMFNNYSQLDADKIHPLSAGTLTIARGLANFIKKGEVINVRERTLTTYAHNSAILTSGDMSIWEINNGDSAWLSPASADFQFSTPQATGILTLGTTATPHYCLGNLTYASFALPCIVVLSDNTTHYLTQEFYIQNGSLKVVSELNNVTRIMTHRTSVVVPKVIC